MEAVTIQLNTRQQKQNTSADEHLVWTTDWSTRKRPHVFPVQLPWFQEGT